VIKAAWLRPLLDMDKHAGGGCQLKTMTVILIVSAGTCLLLVVDSVIHILAARLRTLGRKEKPVLSDTAIVLGAYTDGFKPSPPLVARLRVALHLYRQGVVPTVIVSGGRGTDETVSEATSMKRFLVFNGLPPECVLEDRHSTDTWENLKNSKALMERAGLKSAVIVTSDYHMPRAMAVAKQLKMNVSGYAAYSSDREKKYAVREVFGMVKYTLWGQASIT
jgi:uncharacterized SAM-binding protein YcdF (DUF218 family)